MAEGYGGETLRRDPSITKVLEALGLTKEAEELESTLDKLIPLEGKLIMDACSELTAKILMLGTKDRATLALDVVKAYIAVFDRYVQNYSLAKVKGLLPKMSEPDAIRQLFLFNIIIIGNDKDATNRNLSLWMW